MIISRSLKGTDMFFSTKRVLVAGGTGLVGTPLVKQLVEQGAQVRVVSLDDPSRARSDTEFIRVDLTDYQNCLMACKGIDYVFNLLCVKKPRETSQKYPVNSFEPTVLFNTLLLKAAWATNVGGYFYASSVGVYQPAKVLHEDDVWATLPSQKDWFPGWAKRIGELHLEAYKQQYGWNTSIVRPSNIYGPYDNFDSRNAMFMAYLIRQLADNKNPVVISGDGSQIRDFIHSEDAARGMILAAEKSAGPVNLCSGREIVIKEVVDMLAKYTNYKGNIVYDTSRSSGDARRILDISRLRALGFEPKISLEEGVINTFEWYLKHRDQN